MPGFFASMIAIAAIASAAAFGANAAATYPARPIRLITPYAPGGNGDIMARIIGQRLAEGLRQPVIIDNRPGANGIIGTDLLVHSAPDGYTLLIIAVGHALNPSMERKLPYDTLKDFAPIGLSGTTPMVFVVSMGLPVDSIKSAIAYAKAHPGEIDYGTSGIGSSPQLAGALFALMAWIKLTHVPYKGTAQAITDVMAGHIRAAMASLSGVLPHIHSGKLKALGITASQRSALAPEIPTIAEGGVPSYQANIWNGLLAPAATPRPIIMQLNRELVRQLSLPETRGRYTAVGADVLTSSPEEFDAFIRAEITKWEKVVRAGGMEAN